ncbi:hypothetical protein ACFWA9_00415 [Kitasatospora sp. NPDC059973]|uniref:hypothetical protein n=1 Tax=Kitasatospora sp. NPDC059973 TaxID=3347020 RepID=UPI00367522FB
MDDDFPRAGVGFAAAAAPGGVVVLGAGPGDCAAAIRAAQSPGPRTAVVGAEYGGGGCIGAGGVPSGCGISQQIARHIHAHPTRAKAVEEAVQGLVGLMIDLREARNHL